MTTTLNDAYLEEDVAVLGRKGGGKTYTSKGMVERLLDIGRRVLVIDPLGVWAGLRTSADGEAPGYPVAIFGGTHGDLPLDPAAAVPMADVIARNNVPAVIDISDLSKTAQQSFLLAFLRELRRINTEALTIVLEEADVLAPQNPMGDDSKALHAEIDWIARRGRFRGFRLITITQRPARLSKDVLTQAATLIMHRLPAPQDREAVKAWVDGNGDKDQAREVFDTLARLSVGEAWVWSTVDNGLVRMTFPRIKTLDTSATPRAGERRIEPKTLAQVDLSSIRAALTAAADQEKGSKQAVDRTRRSDADQMAAIEAADLAGFDRGYAAGTAASANTMLANVNSFEEHVTCFIEDVRSWASQTCLETSAASRPAGGAAKVYADQHAAPNAPPKYAPSDLADPPQRERKPKPAGVQKIEGAATALLQAFARYKKRGLTWDEACIVACIVPGNGYFYRGKKTLVDGGYVLEGGATVKISGLGIETSGKAGDPLSRHEIIAQWSGKVGAPGGPMLQHIGKRFTAIDTDSLAAALNMKPGNGYWYRGIKSIRNANLIDQTGGTFRLSAFLLEAS